MPNIAFLSLIYLLLAVPGFLYRSIYHSGQFTRNLLPRSWTDEIGKAILYSVPFHFLGITLFHYLQAWGLIHHTLTMETVLRLMAAEYATHDYSFHGIIVRLYENTPYIMCYYVGVLTAALWAGRQARKLVWDQEYDVKHPWLRYRSDWLYRIMGRGAIKDVPMSDTATWLDVLSEQETGHPGKAVLYRGLAAGYTTEENGALRDIILTDASRTGGEIIDGKTQWKKIPGEFVVMSYSKVRNINITYEQHSKRLLAQISNLPTDLKPPEPAPGSSADSSSS